MKSTPNILLGVTGSINIATIFLYISALQNDLRCRMHVMMTPAAQTFIPATTIMHSIDGDVFVDLSAKGDFKMPHVELTHWADAIVILPASANTVAKVANGFAQDIVSATLLCASSPVVMFPSMYIGMWQKPSVQRNIAQLRRDGYIVYPREQKEAPKYGMQDSEGKVNLNEVDPTGGSLPAPQAASAFVRRVLGQT